MTNHEIFREFAQGFARRKFSAGLLIAFIDFLRALDAPNLSVKSFQGFLGAYPRQERLSSGAMVNTLVVKRPDGSVTSIRPYYNQIELFFRSEKGRFDYPSCAPHATQAWKDYESWLDGLCSMSANDMLHLRNQVIEYVMSELPDQSFDPESVQKEPPLFEMLLSTFDLTAQRGEPTGAAYQGIVFGFLRADNPHLQIEVDKVRTGSKRLQRVGDIDGWDGKRLAVTAEVKQYVLLEDGVDGLRGFFNEANRRGAIGIVAALDFEGNAKALIKEAGIHPVAQADLLEMAGLWDPAKQKIATASLLYYAHHVEKNSGLQSRLAEFLASITVEQINPTDAVPTPQDFMVASGTVKASTIPSEKSKSKVPRKSKRNSSH